MHRCAREKLARNAEAIIGMGMANTVIARWGSASRRACGRPGASTSRASSALSALGARAAADAAGRDARDRRLAGRRHAGVRRDHDCSDDPALASAATRRTSDRRLARDGRCARRVAQAPGALHQQPPDASVALPAPPVVSTSSARYAFHSVETRAHQERELLDRSGRESRRDRASASGKTTPGAPAAGFVEAASRRRAPRWRGRVALGSRCPWASTSATCRRTSSCSPGRVGENIARLGETWASGLRAHRARRAARPRARDDPAASRRLRHADRRWWRARFPAGNASASRWPARCTAIRAIVVLDEPDANLDIAGEAALVAAMADLKARGVTVIMVSHNAAADGDRGQARASRERRTRNVRTERRGDGTPEAHRVPIGS